MKSKERSVKNFMEYVGKHEFQFETATMESGSQGLDYGSATMDYGSVQSHVY